jgi:hypothetical protein
MQQTPTERREQVLSEQRRLGMEPRQDSRLTLQFADGTCDAEYRTATDVAEELVMVDRIHKQTLYGDIIAETMRAVANKLKREYRVVSWTVLWDIVRFYVPTMLKIHCLITAGEQW